MCLNAAFNCTIGRKKIEKTSTISPNISQFREKQTEGGLSQESNFKNRSSLPITIKPQSFTSVMD